jgi:hypothetical protein
MKSNIIIQEKEKMIIEKQVEVGFQTKHTCSTCIKVSKDGKPPLCDPDKLDIKWPQVGPMVCSGYESNNEDESIGDKKCLFQLNK